MVARKDIDAVVIASPGKFHATSTRIVAEAGRDMLCEKPLGLNLPEIEAALAAVARNGVRLQVGHMRRFDPAYAAARKRIEAGEIGEPIIFKSIGRDTEPPPLDYFQSGLNGMLFLDSSVHDFDLARWLMGDEVAEVQAYSSTKVLPYLTEFNDIDAAVVNLRFERGSIGNVESFRQARYGYDIRTEVVGTKGTILIGHLRHTAELVLTTQGAVHDVVSHWLDRFQDAYLRELCAFVDMVASGGQPAVTGEDGLRAVAIGLAAERSCRESRPVRVAPVTTQRTRVAS
jgi:predicted dehydrogenase